MGEVQSGPLGDMISLSGGGITQGRRHTWGNDENKSVK